jgi:hypothetical protein
MDMNELELKREIDSQRSRIEQLQNSLDRLML